MVERFTYPANPTNMLIHTHLAQLLPLFIRERTAQRAMVLATIVRTAGSTYRKAGAQMLIAQSGEYTGLLSGGCLEGDLREHAQQVLQSHQSKIVQYDMRSADDQLFGLGAGCEGAMDILLQAVSSGNDWQPLTTLNIHWQANQATRIALVFNSNRDELPIGSVVLPDHSVITPQGQRGTAPANAQQLLLAQHVSNTLQSLDAYLQLFILECSPPPRLLILGAGPDAQPLATLTQFLGWKLTVYDHRSAYATAARFPHAEKVLAARPEQLPQQLHLDDYHAVVIMSHHLDSDQCYLQALAHSMVPYVGLLGPAARRERLFANLGPDFEKLRQRLYAPVGLQIGAATPEAIALSIISEIHSVLANHTQRGPLLPGKIMVP
jgi:xanthine/CO dehydrogenase XdhC/CoxF family maturation factor